MSSGEKPTQFTSYVDIFDQDPRPPGSPDSLDRLVEVCKEGEPVSADADSWLYIPSDAFLPPSGPSTGQEVGESPRTNRETSSSLCGYLNKHKVGARGLNKSFKRRWFVFADASCKLLYYRTPQDMIPLGEINISTAMFSFDGENVHKQSVFEIRSQNKTYQLEAQDKHTMLFWLQELQKRRRAHSYKRTRASTEDTKPSEGGLLRPNDALPEPSVDDELPSIFARVDTPENTMGSCAAINLGSSSNIKDFSISHWKTEIKNRVAHWRLSRDDSNSQVGNFSPNVPSSPSTSDAPTVVKETEAVVKETTSITKEGGSTRGIQVAGKLVNIKNRFMRPKSSPECGDGLSKTLCHRCKKLQDQLTFQREEGALLEDELQATREVVKIIHKQLDRQQRQAETRKQYKMVGTLTGDIDKDEPFLIDLETSIPTGSEACLQMLLDRDQRLVDLEHLLSQTQQHCCIIKAQLQCHEKEVQGLKEDVEMYQESIAAKDNIVVSLTERMAEIESPGWRRPSAPPAQTDPNPSRLADAREMEKLKDTSEAYRLQNQLLNQELLELSQLRSDDEARELSAQMRYTEMEARFYQVKSKWLLALKELSKPSQNFGGPSDEIVCQLLEDAMNTDSGTAAERGSPIRRPAPLTNRKDITYDRFGFPYLNKSAHIDEEDLEAHADDLLRKSNELNSQAKDLEKDISAHVKWENYLVSLGSRPLQQSADLKNMIRTGVPMEYRSRVWKACIDWRSSSLRQCCGDGHYAALLEHVDVIVNSPVVTPLSRQIEVDLLRTLPDNKHYESCTSAGIPKLRRILLAYSVHNPDVGYCQGLNRVAAIALLFLSEEDAFWALVAIVESLMPRGYYAQSLVAAHADQRVLKDIVADKLPRLTAHVEQHRVDLSLFTFNWFMTIFVDNIPVETFLRIWDTFLYEGSKVLFRYGVAFLKYREEDLLSKTSDLQLHEYLRSIGETMTDVNKIAHIAFNELNPFPMRTIHSRRQTHLLKIKAEMERLDEMRQHFESTNNFHGELPPPESDFNASDDEQI